jgi:hypothetical protein
LVVREVAASLEDLLLAMTNEKKWSEVAALPEELLLARTAVF